ncbi:ABC transporter permease [Tenuibacillus multivorans]|uniref:ABC-2 type transport system permease protein n=1 Tax=Tenuibacillus multivorans TaxID=237069 RepID=A0A1H0AWK1_9BACI|nr:ABC transporter permease [Tenuibacillus multivorans]GEL77788.1 permease [Tenuibacillus multivorans]SDN37759.1 ABC-2 type transport system permease protein [Tenuibacillus multivorans]
MLTFLKKDVLVLFRDKTELAVLLLMPLVLTAILGFALGGLMSGDGDFLNAKVAVVQEDDSEEGLERFINEVDALPIPDEAKEQMIKATESFQPASMLNEVFDSDELGDMLDVTYLNKSEAQEALEDEEISSILRLPEGFTYETLRKMILDQGEGSELIIQSGEHSTLSSGVLGDIMNGFAANLNLETAIAKAAMEEIDQSSKQTDAVNEMGQIESVSDQDPVSSLKYYTFAMAVMFALFTASTMASKAYVENYQNVFDRILLTGKHPYLYLSGKASSTTIIVFIQIAILLIISSMLFQSLSFDSFSQWMGITLITLIFALCIAAIGSLLISITIRSNSNVIPGVFSGGIVSVFAFLGGSFVPTSQLPDIIGKIGSWTPNGMAMNAYLQWSQGLGISFISPLLMRLLILTLVIWILSLLIFPRRREA